MSQNDSQNTNNKKKKIQDMEVNSASSTTTAAAAAMMTEKPSSLVEAGAVPKEQDMITVPREQYQTLLQLNMKSFENTLNILDGIDKIVGSLINMQGFAMNIKETIKRTQLGMTNNSQQQQPDQKPQ